ncbi:MAG: tetratricopeptide repeat protein, partial [Chitinispirillia bacterium]
AIEQYKKNVHLFPDDLRNYEKLNPLLLKDKKYKAALPILLKATKQENCPNIYFKELAEVYSFLNNKTKAAAVYEQYLKNAPNDSLAWYKCGSLYYSVKLYKKAIPALEKSLQLMPMHYESQSKLTDSYIKTGDKKNAINSLHIKLALDPSNEKILLQLANIYKLEKNNQKIAEVYEKLFDLNPNKNKMYLVKAGHIYYKIPIKDKAYSVYNKFIANGLFDPVVSINLARLEFEKKQYQKTISILNELKGKYASDPRVREMLAMSHNLIGTENLTIEEINSLVEKMPYSKKIVEMAAIAYEKKGDIKSAAKMYKRFLTFPKTESHQEYAYHLTTLYEKMDKKPMAIKQYNINIQRFPGDLRNYTNLIEYYMSEKKYSIAAPILAKAVKNPSAPPEFLKNLASIYNRQNNRARASIMYEKYLKKVPDDFEAWNILGSLYFLQQQYKRAITPLEKSITHVPNDSSNYYKLGFSLFRSRQFRNAIDPLQKALESNYNEAQVLKLLSQCYSVVKDTLNLIDILKKRVAIAPKNFQLHIKYGELLLASNQYETAGQVFETLSEMKPKNVIVLKKLIDLYEKTDNKTEWIAAIDRTLKLIPKNPNIHYKKALYHIAINEFEEAKSSLTKTLSFQPNHTLAHYNLAKLLEQEKNYKKANFHFLQALKTKPKNIEYILKFAETSHILGKRNQAIKSLNRALKIDPNNSKALELRESL